MYVCVRSPSKMLAFLLLLASKMSDPDSRNNAGRNDDFIIFKFLNFSGTKTDFETFNGIR